jgi:putative endonuclease
VKERCYYVYIVASRSRVLYTGITGQIEVRVLQHKNKAFDGFSAEYNCNRLVWYERYGDVRRAIGREKQIKGWTRSKKLTLIEKMNPTWIDLSEDWGKPLRPFAVGDKKRSAVASSAGLARNAGPSARD